MSHTPLDGPDGGSRGREKTVEEAPDDDFSGFVGYARRALGRAKDTLRRLVGAAGRSDRSDDLPGRVQSMQRTVQVTDRDAARDRPVTVDGADDRPAHTGTDRGPQNRPELVARWHDGRLTLSEPDEAGAQISSDTWSEVDP